MKLKYIFGVASAAMLALGGLNTASAALTVNTACTLADVNIAGNTSLSCAGAFTGNDSIKDVVDEYGNLGVQDKGTTTALVAADWATGTGPDPVQQWKFGSKLEINQETGATKLETGVLGAGSITYSSAGNFTVNVSPFAEFVLAFKQANDVAFYYFKTDGTGTYSLQWNPSNGGPLAVSHISVYVRGEREVPEPATLALLGLGLVGFGLVRRRRIA